MFIPTNFFTTRTGETASVNYLLVGGGGSGGINYSGGGAGGGFISGSLIFTQYGQYPITIGSGGVSVPITNTSILNHGGATYAFGFVAYGGGSGEALAAGFGTSSMRDGASGGGGGGSVGGFGLAIHNNVYMTQGTNGGASNYDTENDGFSGGGGGGANITGSSILYLTGSGADKTYRGGNGGAGKQWLDANYYGGGGAGGTRGRLFNYNPGTATGGIGGGGSGATYYFPEGYTALAQNGVTNTGGGGGGRVRPLTGELCTSGGSGIVKIRYPGGYKPNIVGGTITQSGSFTFHTFTSSANLTYSPSEQLSSSLDLFPSGAITIYDFGNKSCYPGTGSSVYDLCANAVGTFTGTFETGSGGILRLNSASNQRVAYSGSITPSVTIVSIWKNVNSTFPESALCDASFNYGIKTSTLAATKQYVPVLYTNFDNTFFGATNTLSDVQVFHQYASVVSAVGGSSTATTYIDGSGSAASETKSFNRNQNGTGVIYLGFDRAGATRYSNGWLMAHLHYNRTLSEAELQQIYSVFSTRF